MSFLFGGAPPTTSDLARRYKLAISRAIRDIDMEAAQLHAQEKIMMQEVRRAAETNPTMTIQKARAVVRSRRMQARFSNMKAQLQDVGARILHVRSAEALEGALASANRTMACFSTRLGDAGMNKNLREFARNSARIGAQTDLADETLDSIFDDEADGEDDASIEADRIIVSVLEEAGVKLPSPNIPASTDSATRNSNIVMMMRSTAQAGGGGSGVGGDGGIDVNSSRAAGRVLQPAMMTVESLEQRLHKLKPANM